MSISELRTRVNEELLDFAWRQWAQIGVSSTVEGADGWTVDPEALILFTIGIGRRDPRLFDEMLDWMAFNHELLSMQRLRNLTSRFPVPAGLVAAVIAWTRQASTNMSADQHPGPGQAGELVFSPDVMALVSRPDTVFAEHGFLRPTAVRTGKSHEPDPALPVNLSFRLRHLFGPGGRSETMRVLLTCSDGPLDAARVAEEAGFAKRNINDVLVSLTASGVIRAAWAGNERRFSAHREGWALFLGLVGSAELPSFVSWIHLLPAALKINQWLNAKTDTAESAYLIASQARSLISHLTRDLEAADIYTRHPRSALGTKYLSVFAQTTSAMLARLRAAQ